jgi:hypothetical protein
MTIDTIDLTPTFEEATAISIAVIENFARNENPNFAQVQAMRDAKAELMRYGRELDRLKKILDPS